MLAMMHPSTMTQPGRVTARAFFADLCPRLLIKARIASDARFAFDLEGAQGGAWTIDLEQRSVTSGVAPDADVGIVMSADDFAAMLAGELDTLAAYRAGAVRVSGAIEKLDVLGTLFANHEE